MQYLCYKEMFYSSVWQKQSDVYKTEVTTATLYTTHGYTWRKWGIVSHAQS